MSVVGGFQYIDLQGREMNSVTVKVDGIFNKIASSLKPVVLCNFTYDQEQIRNTIFNIYNDGDAMYGVSTSEANESRINFYVIVINRDDSISLTTKSITF